jgi:hypothetical protein
MFACSYEQTQMITNGSNYPDLICYAEQDLSVWKHHVVLTVVVSSLDFSPRRSGFDHRPICMGFEVDNVALG